MIQGILTGAALLIGSIMIIYLTGKRGGKDE